MHFIKHYKQQNWNFEKLLCLQVFKHHNSNPIQSSLTLSICSSFLYLLYYLYFVSFHSCIFIYVSLSLVALLTIWILKNFVTHNLKVSFHELQLDFSFSSSLICLSIKGIDTINFSALSLSKDTICGLSLLLVFSFSPRGFYLGTPVFPAEKR